MQVEVNTIRVRQERSYIKCLKTGIREGFRQQGLLMRFCWASLLFSILCPIVGPFFFFGQTDVLLRKWIEQGSLPRLSAFALKKETMYCTKRNFTVFVMELALLIVTLSLMGLPVLLKWSLWWSLLPLCLAFLVWIPCNVVFMELSFTSRDFGTCLDSFRLGIRRFTHLFAFHLLCFIFCCVGLLMVFLPFVVILAVHTQANISVQMGDIPDLPAYFPVLAVLAYVLTTLLCLCLLQVFRFATCLVWGSLVKEVPTDPEVEV